jgi:hypothetical protein
MKTLFNLFFLLLVLLSHKATGQVLLSGTISDEKEIPIPNARVYVKNNAELRTEADVNGYYELRLFPGEYFLVFNASGYNERESWVVITDMPVARDIQLFPVLIRDIEDVQVTAKKSNPGREIMLKVVAKRDSINPWNYPHIVDGYIKATEKLDGKPNEEKDKKSKQNREETNTTKDIDDPFEEERKKQTNLANNMNLVEVQFTRNYAPPVNVKEVRNAYEKRGNDRNLYYTTTVKFASISSKFAHFWSRYTFL